MAPSDSDIARLRRMVNEPTEDTYDNETLSEYLSVWPLVDSYGRDSINTNWTEAYDLHAAAADIWEEKAALFQVKHDFSADGAQFSSSQLYETAMKNAKHHRAEQKAKVRTMPNPIRRRDTYYPTYQNPIFDEDETPDWTDSVV